MDNESPNLKGTKLPDLDSIVDKILDPVPKDIASILSLATTKAAQLNDEILNRVIAQLVDEQIQMRVDRITEATAVWSVITRGIKSIQEGTMEGLPKEPRTPEGEALVQEAISGLQSKADELSAVTLRALTDNTPKAYEELSELLENCKQLMETE